MATRIMVFFALSLTGSACVASAPEPPDDQPEHAVLEGLEAPPLNRPLLAQAAQAEPAAPARFQPGSPVLIVTVDGAPFSGRLNASGTVSVSDSIIEFTLDDQRSVRILYRAPAPMTALRVGDGVGALRLMDRSGPAGADRTLAIDRNGALLMSEIWQSDAEPIRFELGSGLTLQQGRVEAAPTQGAVAAPLDVQDAGDAVARVSIGEVTTVQGRAGAYQVFVETSQLSARTDPDGQFGGGYVLHAWIFRVEG